MGNSDISIDYSFLAIAILLIAFYGEPDLIDAIIYYLMNGGGVC